MKNIRLRQRRAHQDDNFAKLWHELLSVRKLIAKILVTVSRIKIKRTKEMPAKLRAFRKYAQIVRLRQRRIHQADNLVKLRQEFLSMFDLITEIFCAVSRLKIKQTREMPAKLRAFRKYAMIFSLVLLFLVLCKLCFHILEAVFDGVCKRVGHCLDVNDLGVVGD